MGANVHSKEEREMNDFYATHPTAIETALPMLKKYGLSQDIIEPCCGNGNISTTLKNCGYNVKSYDIVNRGYDDMQIQDFLTTTEKTKGDILTNPPFRLAEAFIRHSMNLMSDTDKAFFFLKVQFLEGANRYKMFKEFPPKVVLLNSKRQWTAKNGDFENYHCKTMFYVWLVLEKGYKGETKLD